MHTNRVKKILKEGGLALGTYTGGIADPQIVEIIGHAGFDAAFIDMEHTSFDLRDVQLMVMAAERVAGIFAKAEASPSGVIRGRRHTMIDDSDINHTRHARAAVSAVIASVIGDPMVYVSGGAEHQGPSGGGPVAAIVRRG